MNARRLLSLLALLVAFGLIAAACGGDDGATSPADTDQPSDDPAPEAEPEPEPEPEGEPEPEAEPEPEPELGYGVHNVPADYATIQAAVDAAEPGDLVLIDEGVYHEAVVVQTDNIVVRGMDRNGVVLDGEHAEGFENGIIVSANGVAIENLTVRNFTRNGLFWTGDYASDFFVEGYRASYVTAHNIGVYGMYAFNAVDGQFDHTYSGGSDDSSYYVGQCVECNALLYEVEGENSQLGYSGTNSSGTIIANSWFHDNIIGVVPNSQSGEELAPNRDTVIIGNLIENNNNLEVPARTPLYGAGFGSGVALAGVSGNIVERNTIVGNDRAGVIVIDWVAEILGGDTDYEAEGNIVRDNVFGDSTDDVILFLTDDGNGGQGNCFEGNAIDASTPADAETVLACGGDDTATMQTFEELLPLKFDFSGFEPVPYEDIPWPDYDFPNMPGDPATDPPAPAIDVPMAIDLDAIVAPPPTS